MKPYLNKILSSISLIFPTIFFTSCVQTTIPAKTTVYSTIPVDIKLDKEIIDKVKVISIRLTANSENYIFQAEIKNITDEPINVLYRAIFFNQQGLASDFLTNKWNYISIDPRDTVYIRILVPKQVIKKPSKVILQIKTFTNTGG